MRRHVLRATIAAAPAASLLVAPARGIYTVWGSTPNEEWATRTPWIKRITNQRQYRSFEFWHVPVVEEPDGVTLSAVETYLLSCIEDDTNRLMNISWTYDFDPFWKDRVNSHNMLFDIIYKNRYPVYKYLFGDYSSNEAARSHIEKKLNYLTSMMHWAAMTERRYTAIVKARYAVQREVWNAVERERYLAGCVEIVESFKRKIPKEFASKAIGELENDLVNMRHWVWDCPNAKRTFEQLS
ncbi:succinate dehydrogenase subunit [Trypanosoma grayi]|uniref:succinate dehydrogenase subunit n=1 Tax=Trypanosoma grayi TaxID=71804 RepID=UPI0004F41C56|nr:succinate dehydrogenase subunit [Trypanosoma grayi]KEG12424.1 succinate dehydrogenase subunit [Trypanosoma grayi]